MFLLTPVVPYSSEVQQPYALPLSWTDIRIRTRLHRLAATRTVPLVCIQMLSIARPLPSSDPLPS